MIALDAILSHVVVWKLGWVLVHSLWQIAAIAAVLGAAPVVTLGARAASDPSDYKNADLKDDPATTTVAASEGRSQTEAVTTPDPLDMTKARAEVEEHYAAAHPEIREYVLWTARTFGRSGMWLNEDAFTGMPDAEREKKVVYLAALLSDSEYGRHLCHGLAEASALKDERLVPGLLKVAGYHREGANYDCRPKWIAVSALARQESDQAVPLLISLVDHGNQNTRKWARAALARKTGQDFKEDKQAWAKWRESQGHDPVWAKFLEAWRAPTQEAGEADAPDFTDVQWQTVASATFDDDQPDGTRFTWNFPGLAWDITNGTARVRGTSQTNKWSGTRITLPVEGDKADLVEVSGDFTLPQHEGYHLVALFGQTGQRGKENLCMFFEGRNGIGHYRIQTRWATLPTRLVAGRRRTEGFGDETERFHKMRMILDRAASRIYYYVDDRHLGTVKVDGDIDAIKAIEMDFESPDAGNATEVLYDNLTVRSGIR